MSFAILFDFLKTQGLSMKDIAYGLEMEYTFLSKIKNGNKQMPTKKSPEFFYESVFDNYSHLLEEQVIDSCYSYLKNKSFLNETIDKSYKEYKINPQDPRKFYLTVIRVVYDQSNIASKKETDKESDVSDVYSCFESFKNPLSNTVFFGRDEMFKDINSRLVNFGTCIIYGIGGLGKSFCALKYALEYGNNYSQIQQVIYSSSIKNTILKINFIGLDEKQLNDDERFENRMSILSKCSANTLLIIDNMDSQPVDRENYERLKKLNLHLLITTRETDLDSQKLQIHIHPLSEEEQIKLFMHYGNFTIEENEYQDYYEIFKMVEGHTLLLELIAKTMATEALTPDEIKELLNNPESDNTSKVYIEKDNTYQQEKMNYFVSKLFDTSNLSNPQKDILMNLSLTDISGINQRTMRSFLGCDNSDINTLINQSWIIKTCPAGPASAIIHLHPVIKAAVIQNTNPELDKCQPLLSRIVDTYNENEFKNLSQSDIDALCDILSNSIDMFSFEFSDLTTLHAISNILWKSLKYQEAYQAYKTGLTIISSCDNAPIDTLLSFYVGTGEVAVRIAKYEKAIKYYKKAIDAITDENTESIIRRIKLLDKLAMVMRKSSQYDKALEYFTEAQRLIDRYSIDDPSLIADILNDTGVTYVNMDKQDEALEYYQKAKSLRENMDNPDLKKLAYSYHNIGTVFNKKKLFDEAIKYHNLALEMRKKAYSENDPIIASSLTWLGNDYTEAAKHSEQYQFSDALTYFECGLKLRELSLGKIHPDTAWSHQSIGNWYFYQKKYDDALNHYQECLSIRNTILQPYHKYTADVLYSIAEVYAEINDYVHAADYIERAIQIQEFLKLEKDLIKSYKLLSSIS